MTLEEAIKAVQTLGLAPLARIAAAEPKNMLGTRYSSWTVRRHAVELQVAEQLRAQGAAISIDGDKALIAFAGVRTGSTIGIGKALKNWKAIAERRLPKRGRR